MRLFGYFYEISSKSVDILKWFNRMQLFLMKKDQRISIFVDHSMLFIIAEIELVYSDEFSTTSCWRPLAAYFVDALRTRSESEKQRENSVTAIRFVYDSTRVNILFIWTEMNIV